MTGKSLQKRCRKRLVFHAPDRKTCSALLCAVERSFGAAIRLSSLQCRSHPDSLSHRFERVFEMAVVQLVCCPLNAQYSNRIASGTHVAHMMLVLLTSELHQELCHRPPCHRPCSTHSCSTHVLRSTCCQRLHVVLGRSGS